MKIKAFIFDFDGIITDTEPVHMEAWQGVLDPLGITFDEDEFREHYLGLNDRDFLDAVSRIHRAHFTDADRADMIEDKVAATLRMLEHDIPVLPGIVDFVREVSKGYSLAICSGAARGEIEFILKQLKLADVFKPIVASDSVKKGKPDPEGYIRAFEGLVERSDDALIPEYVVAVEDTPKGIAAAKAAGLRCLAVQNSYDASVLKDADWIVKSLTDFDLLITG